MKKILLWFASLGCPGFWRDFPKENKPGPWVAVAIRFSPWHEREVARLLLPEASLQEAYVKARKLARFEDWTMPKCGGWEEVGIRWAVRRPIAGETYDNTKDLIRSGYPVSMEAAMDALQKS